MDWLSGDHASGHLKRPFPFANNVVHDELLQPVGATESDEPLCLLGSVRLEICLSRATR